MDTLEHVFGAIVRKFREAKSMTKTELAGRCGLDRTTIAKIESGKINPTIRVVFKISKGLEIPSIKIITELEEKNVKLD